MNSFLSNDVKECSYDEIHDNPALNHKLVLLGEYRAVQRDMDHYLDTAEKILNQLAELRKRRDEILASEKAR